LKFLAVGAFSFVVETGSLTALVLVFSMNRVAAKAIAFALAVLSNFIWHRFWTYAESRSKHVLTQAAQFTLLSVIGLGINLLAFRGADLLLVPLLGSVPALYAAQCTAVGVTLFWNLLANRLITYSDVKLGH
jgi:putative flippase GtrA